MNITRVKKLPYAQRIWKFTLDDTKYMYITNRKRKYTEVFNIDNEYKFYHIINEYLPLDDTNRERDIRKFFALVMLQ